MRIVAIIQARLGSSRLPGKVLAKLNDVAVIDVLLHRLGKSKLIDEVVVAIPEGEADYELFEHLNAQQVSVFRGDERDVLRRFFDAAQAFKADAVVRITADCPCLEGVYVDGIVRHFTTGDFDYVSNIDPPTFPDGFDVEIFSREVLNVAHQKAIDEFDREHVTSYIRKCFPRRHNVTNSVDNSALRLTLDTRQDLNVIDNVFAAVGYDFDVPAYQLMDLVRKRPDLLSGNSMSERNEGGHMSKGYKHWQRANGVIAGGNMLLSKNPNLHLPGAWPTYFSSAKGCSVWDIEGRELCDTYLMGVGTNTLGYGHEEVDEAVLGAVRDGNMSTLNAPEEVLLAEEILVFNPWADKVKFARTGGEANAIAIRLARAMTGRSKIAICGYHGWHDWYLSANLGGSENLSGHLLPGLPVAGVPAELQGTILPFEYNDLQRVESLLKGCDVAAVKMEVMRNLPPTDGFLEKVRQLTQQTGTLLIFDECTSGFRETFGGLHTKFSIKPDLCVYGKTIGNGYALTAVAGTKDVMNVAEKTFISSTFWTERIGTLASLKTLEVMQREKSWEFISQQGRKVKDFWQTCAERHGLVITVTGLDALPTFSFQSAHGQVFKTYMTQEMLKLGFLAGPAFYTCLSHSDEVLAKYDDALDQTFKKISLIWGHANPVEFLEGEVASIGFGRLN